MPEPPTKMPDARPATDERPVGGLSAHLESAWLLGGVRYFLPAIVVLAGLVVMAFGSEADLEGGASILSAGLAVYFLNWLFRAGAAGDRERDAEDAARAYFDRHGRWPE